MVILLNEGFESATVLSGYNREAISGGVSRSLTQAKNGVAACKFIINKADTGYGGGPHRSEIHSPVEEYLFNQDYWIGCNVYLENWATDPEPEQIIQFHNVPNFGAGETWGTLKLLTPFGIQIKNNTYEIVHGFVQDSDAANPNGTLNNNRVSAGAITNNGWTKWVIHCRWHYSTGILEVWKDDVLVYSKAGNTYYNDEKGPYHKVGIYKWPWTHVGNISTTTQRTMYLDNWKIAQGSGTTYNDVDPQPNNMTSDSPNIIVTVTQAGTYTGRLIVTANGLSTEKAVEVIVKPDPTPPVPPEVTPFPVTSLTYKDTVALAKPAYMGSVIENMFGYDVKITRVSTSKIENPTYFPRNTASDYMFDHGYSTRQMWSRNGTYLRLGNYVLCDGSTYVPIKYMDSSYKLWSNVTDDKLYCFYNAGYVRVYRPSLRAFQPGNVIDLRSIPGIDASPKMTVGYYEGNLSMDDSKLILNCMVGGKPRNILVNPLNGQILWNKSDTDFNTGVDGMNTITVSQSGLYVLTTRYPIGGVTSQNKQSFKISGEIIQANLGGFSHREVAFTAGHREMMIGTNPPVMHDILTGEQTILLSTASMQAAFQKPGGSVQVYGGHSSGRAYDLRGWMLHCGGADAARYMEQLFVRMDGSGDVMRVCNARMTNGRGQNPQSSPNWDGSKILFKSDWGNATGPIDAYIAELV